jgi:hypothetical protein
MIKNNSTTNFYHPDTIRMLQESGVIFVLGQYPNPYTMIGADTKEEFLVGNHIWLTKVCEIYQIPIVYREI